MTDDPLRRRVKSVIRRVLLPLLSSQRFGPPRRIGNIRGRTRLPPLLLPATLRPGKPSLPDTGTRKSPESPPHPLKRSLGNTDAGAHHPTFLRGTGHLFPFPKLVDLPSTTTLTIPTSTAPLPDMVTIKPTLPFLKRISFTIPTTLSHVMRTTIRMQWSPTRRKPPQ